MKKIRYWGRGKVYLINQKCQKVFERCIKENAVKKISVGGTLKTWKIESYLYA